MFDPVTLDTTSHAPPAVETLPSIFCWTKMGSEAGQELESILRRKELERLSGDGLFAWGIGNSVGPAVRHARALGLEALDVLFTRMKSPPKAVDVAPSTLVLWNAYEDDHGKVAPLPAHILVTSRGNTTQREGLKKMHYALICRSVRSLLAPAGDQAIDPSAVCNLVSHNPTGASQVTAVVRTRPSNEPRRPYPIQFRATLADPGFVRLCSPTPLTGDLLPLYNHALAATDPRQWRERVETLRLAARPDIATVLKQGRLFDV